MFHFLLLVGVGEQTIASAVKDGLEDFKSIRCSKAVPKIVEQIINGAGMADLDRVLFDSDSLRHGSMFPSNSPFLLHTKTSCSVPAVPSRLCNANILFSPVFSAEFLK